MAFRDWLRAFLAATKRFVLRTLGGIALFGVFVLSGFIALRIAIHGREVTVPSLANLSDADADAALKKLGLNLSVENRFYADTVPANHVLSQAPLPGARVRRGWQIRVTESLGTQQVPVPDVTGQEEHPAELMLKRLQLDLGAVAHIPGPGPDGTILAQSPPPNSASIDGPRVSILVADAQDTPPSVGYVMPSLIGMTVGNANARLASVGLHIASSAAPADATDAINPVNIPADPAIPPTIAVPMPATTPRAVIVSQSPLAGHRVSRADNIRVTVSGGT
jgi:beta-lactam-binding protein with PASTA domain